MDGARGEGFEGDFGFYSRRGSIGDVTMLFTETESPEIGSNVSVRVTTGGRAARVFVGERSQKVDNELLHVQVLEDRVYHLRLVDDHSGEELHSIKLTPRVIVPRVRRLVIPSSTTYADPMLRVDLEVADVEQVRAEWCIASEAHWQSLDLIGGAYFLPVPQHPCLIQIRLTLESRHAALSPRAKVEFLREVRVTHPIPAVMCTPSERVVVRKVPVSCEVECCWVTEVRIDYNGCGRSPYKPARDHRVVAPMALDTQALGQQRIVVRALGLDGEWYERAFEYEVRARQCEIHVEDRIPGIVKFDIKGGVRAWFTIPGRNVHEEVRFSAGTISHDFVVPEQARLTAVDDKGELHHRDFVLDSAPHLRQPFSPL